MFWAEAVTNHLRYRGETFVPGRELQMQHSSNTPDIARREPSVYAAGGVLIFGWRRSDWSAKNDPAPLQAPHKVVDAALGFKAEGDLQETICWNDAMLFEVSLSDYHQFLLLRRKLAANDAAHLDTP